MNYPNLIFINNVIDKYIEGRVKKSSPDNLSGLAINLFTTAVGKPNNVSDVIQKFSIISLECSDAFLKPTENEMAEKWVDIAILLGKIAFTLDQHHSHEIAHMLRTYIILCAETWPALQLAFTRRAHALSVEQMRLRKVIIKTEKALGIAPQLDEDEVSDEEIEQEANENEAKKTADELAKESKKNLAELREDRGEIKRSLVYIGKIESIADNKALLKQLFPQLSVAGKFKKLKNFKIIPTIPLVLHPNYYIVYSNEFFSKTLQEQIMEYDRAHHYKYNQTPAFLQHVHAYQNKNAYHLTQQEISDDNFDRVSSSSTTILKSVSRQTSQSVSRQTSQPVSTHFNPPMPSPLSLTSQSSLRTNSTSSPIYNKEPELNAGEQAEFSPSTDEQEQAEQGSFSNQEQARNDNNKKPELNAGEQEIYSSSADRQKQTKSSSFSNQAQAGNVDLTNYILILDGQPMTINAGATPVSTVTAEVKHEHSAPSNNQAGQSTPSADGSTPPHQLPVLTSLATNPAVKGIFAPPPAPPHAPSQTTNQKSKYNKKVR